MSSGSDSEMRCCPGRGKLGDKCFDWANGGVHELQLALTSAGVCVKTWRAGCKQRRL